MGREPTAVAEELGRAHAALLDDLQKLEAAARTDSAEGLAELRQRLDSARTHVAEHFRFEEQQGYMDVVRQREPRLERLIQQLAEEHRELERSLDLLIGAAGAATGPGDGLREEVRAWVSRVRHHESRENELVQDAFNLDIGAED